MNINQSDSLPLPALIMLVSLFLGACSSHTLLSAEPGGYPPGHYLAWLESAEPAALEHERERLARHQGSPAPVANVQLAMLLSSPQFTSRENENLAMSLINELEPDAAGNAREQEYLLFAGIWRQILELRWNLQHAQQRNDSLEQEISDIRAQNRRLQEQISTLTTIERQLIEREQSQE